MKHSYLSYCYCISCPRSNFPIYTRKISHKWRNNVLGFSSASQRWTRFRGVSNLSLGSLFCGTGIKILFKVITKARNDTDRIWLKFGCEIFPKHLICLEGDWTMEMLYSLVDWSTNVCKASMLRAGVSGQVTWGVTRKVVFLVLAPLFSHFLVAMVWSAFLCYAFLPWCF